MLPTYTPPMVWWSPGNWWNPAQEAWPGGPHPGAIAAMQAQTDSQGRISDSPVSPPPPLSEQELEKLRAAKAQYDAYRDGWQEAVRAAFNELKGTPRLLQVIRSTLEGGRSESAFRCSERWVTELLPEYDFAGGLDLRSPPWSDEKIARWFARNCKTPASRIRVDQRLTLLGWKDQYVEGWVFTRGSTVLWQHPNGVDSWLLSCGVTTGGLRLHARAGYSSVSLERTQPDDRFNARTLATMAAMAGLPQLDLYPPPPWT